MGAAEPSYTLKGVWGVLPPLVDERGRKFDWIPCQDDPGAWDEDRPIGVRRNAARLCLTECPALARCDERRVALGKQARGVWAGKIMTKRGEHNPDDEDDTSLPVALVTSRRRRVASAVTAPLPDSMTVVHAEAH